MANVVVAGEDFDFDGAIGIGGAAGVGVVGEAVLRAQLAGAAGRRKLDRRVDWALSSR